ncbi:MAG TPA: low temperature requirement protein A [Solirubrobacteraceae bacterium]|nr:low temperature requirement protein A [Solirubrobacteraceae bacterium]
MPPSEHPTARGERRTSNVELLWDLVFVFAITQVTTLLAHELTWGGAARALLMLALVWWAWSAFVWAANAAEANVLRAALLPATVAILISGLAIPHAFAGAALLAASTYVAVRLLHLALYVDASRRGAASLRAIAGFAVTVAVGMGLLLAGAFAHGVAREGLWAGAVAIDYAGPGLLTRARLRGLQEVAVAHFAERYGLFVIICLGESIAVLGASAAGEHLAAATVAGVALGALITIAMWWTYFARFAGVAEGHLRSHSDPVLAASDAYSYLHLVIVAGIIVFAAGAKVLARHADATLADGPRLALCGGVALFLVGLAAFRRRLSGSWGAERLVAAAAALVLAAVTAAVAAWVLAGLLAMLLAGLCAAEAVRAPGALT